MWWHFVVCIGRDASTTSRCSLYVACTGHAAVMGPRYNKANFVGVVTLLIQSGANLEAVSGIKRETPLIIAADRRSGCLSQFLLVLFCRGICLPVSHLAFS